MALGTIRRQRNHQAHDNLEDSHNVGGEVSTAPPGGTLRMIHVKPHALDAKVTIVLNDGDRQSTEVLARSAYLSRSACYIPTGKSTGSLKIRLPASTTSKPNAKIVSIR